MMPEKGRKWEQVSLDYRESDTTQNAAVWTRLVFFRVCFLRARKVNTYSAVFLIEKYIYIY